MSTSSAASISGLLTKANLRREVEQGPEDDDDEDDDDEDDDDEQDNEDNLV